MKWLRRTRQQQTGGDGELAAEQELTAAGLKLITRNYHCRGGEIDLIMQDGNTLVFVEVRVRNNSRFGSAEESIGFRKQQRLQTAALHFLQHHRRYQHAACRFDSYCITDGKAQWLKNAFQT